MTRDEEEYYYIYIMIDDGILNMDAGWGAPAVDKEGDNHNFWHHNKM